MAEVYSLAKARRRDQAPAFMLPASFVIFAETFGVGMPKQFEKFTLRRTRGRGTVVYLIGGALSINLSYVAKVYPASFKEARKWVAAVAERQGWQLVEITKREQFPEFYAARERERAEKQTLHSPDE